MIEINGLKKAFGSKTVVNIPSLIIRPGEIYGLVGSDGAGKTTTLRLIVGALKADEGEISICGFNVNRQVEQARSKIGYLSQRFSLYEDLSVLENIRFFAEVRGLNKKEWLPRCLEILEFVGLANFKDRKSGFLSGGMKQKLGLASALVTQPQILLLDEPTTGVDPLTRQDFWQLLVRLVKDEIPNSEQVSVILTTPYMDEAVRCNRIGFMKEGEIITEGTPSELRNKFPNPILEISTSKVREVEKVSRQIQGVEEARIFGRTLHLTVNPGEDEIVIQKLKEKLGDSRIKIFSISRIPATLEDVFMYISNSKKIHNKALLDLPEKHFEALSLFMEKVPCEQFNWFLSASGSLRLHGVDVEVHDLDIRCQKEHIKKIGKLMSEYMTVAIHEKTSKDLRCLNGEIMINGVKLELIAGFEYKDKNNTWTEMESGPIRWISSQGLDIPVNDLEIEARNYEEMGRPERAELVRKTIQQMKEDSHE